MLQFIKVMASGLCWVVIAVIQGIPPIPLSPMMRDQNVVIDSSSEHYLTERRNLQFGNFPMDVQHHYKQIYLLLETRERGYKSWNQI